MTYKLNPELRVIQSPVMMVIGDDETDYPNGEALVKLVFEKRYSVERMTARDGKVVILLQERSETPDSNEAWAMGAEMLSFS